MAAVGNLHYLAFSRKVARPDALGDASRFRTSETWQLAGLWCSLEIVVDGTGIDGVVDILGWWLCVQNRPECDRTIDKLPYFE